MLIRVKLPSGSLINYWGFCKAIADAVGPRYKSLEGVDCVSEKIYPPDVETPIPDIAGPYPLDDADRQKLSIVLKELPLLHYPMSEKEVASFMEAYGNLAKRPEWIPHLVNEEAIHGRKKESEKIADRHLKALREEHKAGRIVPVNASHAPINAVDFGAYLTRRDAIAYLERHGLAFDDGETVASAKQDTVSSETAPQSDKFDDRETATGPVQDSVSSEAVTNSDNADQLTLSGKKKRGNVAFDATTKASAVEFCKSQKEKGKKDFVKRAAKKFQTSERSIYAWVKEANEKLKHIHVELHAKLTH